MSAPHDFSRRWLLGALLAGAALPACANAPERSKRPMARTSTASVAAAPRAAASSPGAAALIEAARLGGRVSCAVVDMRSGVLLEAVAPHEPQPPASVAKAVTALYALDRLGEGHRFATRLIATGPVSGGRIAGDLVLSGTGDPTLTTDALGDLAAALKARGVQGITGRFLVHGAALPQLPLIDPEQPEHVGYNPAISGLNLNYNRVHFQWSRAQGGWAVRMDARADRFVPDVRMARMRVVDRDRPVYTYSTSGTVEDWTVASRALGNGGSRWLPVRRPDLYAGEVFQTLARAQGIALPDAQAVGRISGGAVLAEVTSPPLRTVARDMLRWSTNLTAEVLGLSASGESGLTVSGARMAEWAAGHYGMQAAFVDHSGLGVGSRATAAGMARALAQAGAGPLRPILRDFTMRDAQGREMRNHPLKVAAKTGTLNFVSGLGGYVTTPGGRDLAFAIFAADLPRRAGLAATERERPAGGREWTGRARGMQSRLLERWAAVF